MRTRRNRNAELATVIRLACLTEHRSDDEQRALVAVAWSCDVEHNRLTTTNRGRRLPDWEPQNLVVLVLETRTLEDGDREVQPPKGWEKRWQTWKDAWTCLRCGKKIADDFGSVCWCSDECMVAWLA